MPDEELRDPSGSGKFTEIDALPPFLNALLGVPPHQDFSRLGGDLQVPGIHAGYADVNLELGVRLGEFRPRNPEQIPLRLDPIL